MTMPPSEPGLTTEQRHQVVGWLTDVTHDPGWFHHAAREAAWQFHWWMTEAGLALVPIERQDDDA